MKTVAIDLNPKHLLVCGAITITIGFLLCLSGVQVTIGMACVSIFLGMTLDFLGLPLACALSYIGGLNISGFVLLGFGFGRFLMAWYADRLNNGLS